MFLRSGIGKKLKITACVIGALLLFVVLFSSFYIAVEAQHDCTGEECSVCACIEQCEAVLHTLTGYGAAAAIIVSAVIFVLCICLSGLEIRPDKTPVSMRVRLNN